MPLQPAAPIRDTDAAAEELLAEAYQRMGPAARLDAAFQLSDDVRSLALAGVLHRERAGGAQAHAAFLRLWLGPDVAEAVLARPPRTAA